MTDSRPGRPADPPGVPARPSGERLPSPATRTRSAPTCLRPPRLVSHPLRGPRASAGRSWYLVFPQNNLNTTVFVNGIYCGFDKDPFARVQIDVTRAIKPGANEVWVGIRDAWYG